MCVTCKVSEDGQNDDGRDGENCPWRGGDSFARRGRGRQHQEEWRRTCRPIHFLVSTGRSARCAFVADTHTHTTRAHPPSKKRRVEKKRTKKKKKKKRSAGEKLEKGRNKKKKKKPPRKCCTLSLSLFFFFSVPGENWSVERVRFFLFLPSLFLRHFAQRKHLAHDEWNEKTNAAQSLCVVVVVVVGPPFFFFFLFNHFETDTPIDKWTEIELRVRVWWV